MISLRGEHITSPYHDGKLPLGPNVDADAVVNANIELYTYFFRCPACTYPYLLRTAKFCAGCGEPLVWEIEPQFAEIMGLHD